LESSLKQLANDGIFISVAAGNSFLTYNTAGLSYPAVSSSVTPSPASMPRQPQPLQPAQSKRARRPGEKIMSTLPDAFYGSEATKTTGALPPHEHGLPYVAGASVLVREAMQDLGYTQITQGTIDDLFHRTADKVSTPSRAPPTTNQRLASPQHAGRHRRFWLDVGSATSVGQLTTKLQVSGTIGSTSDQDFFQFTATRSGQATLTLTGNQKNRPPPGKPPMAANRRQ